MSTEETCPYCDTVNTIKLDGRTIGQCKKCGHLIFICSTCEYCKDGDCNYHENKDGTKECHAGVIKEVR